MSLEAALDEERRDVMALLEGRAPPSRSQLQAQRAASPSGITQSPVRSMLDFGDDHSPTPFGRHASIAGQGVGISSPNQASFPQYQSMLHPRSPSVASHMTSPPSLDQRSKSPAVIQPPRINVEKEYNFEILPTNEHGSLPKRAAQGNKKSSTDNNNTHSEASRPYGAKSKSKSPGRFFGRSSSPPTKKKLNTNASGLMTGPNVFVGDNGQLIDMSNAYRRLSDAALLRSGGALANMAYRKGSDPTKGEMLAPDGGIRLTVDLQDEDVIDSSDDESHSSDDDWGNKRRGRDRRRKGEEGDDVGETQPQRQAKSLLAAAESERKSLVANTKITSLLDPMVPGIDAVDGKPLSSKKSGIHPRTSYDVNNPTFVTPHGSDDEEEMDDIRRAQSLQMLVSPIHSDTNRHRSIQQILRGHYRELAEEAAQGLRRQRLYLVATDLSEEAAYALEWTIGTVLKDGDTLFAIYAADTAETGEATGSQPPKTSSSSSAESSVIDIGQGAAAMQDTAEMVRVLSNNADSVILTQESARPGHKQISNVNQEVSQLTSRSLSRGPPLPVTKLRRTDFSGMARAERVRWKATEGITERCIALLRKTKLQVRVVVDVFHCKSPKHMITEVIDYLEPTLVVLGSRGRSAIKGVLLGSFSNYLVTKSSVPVMVARKKLKKNKSLKRPNLRFSNVLQTPGSSAKLADAKIDKVLSKSD